jgi:hypothetical protein
MTAPIRGAVSQDAGYTLPYGPGAIAAFNALNADIKRLYDSVPLTPDSVTGSGDVMVASFTPAVPAYVDGLSAWITPPGANTTEPTCNFGPGAKTIKSRKGAALAAGAMSGGVPYLVRYHAASGFLRLAFSETDLAALLSQFPYGYLSGFLLDNNPSDPNNYVDIGPGACRDSSNTQNMASNGMVRRFDTAWAAGASQGTLLFSSLLAGVVTVTAGANTFAGAGTAFTTDFETGDCILTNAGQMRRIIQITGAGSGIIDGTWSANEVNAAYRRGGRPPNSVLRLFAIYNNNSGDTDFACSMRDVPVDLPANYTKYRRIGYLLTDASANLRQFVQSGDVFRLLTKLQDYSGTQSTGPTTIQSSAPPNMIALYEWLASDLTPAGPTTSIKISMRESQVGAGNGRQVLWGSNVTDGAPLTMPAYFQGASCDAPVLLNASAQFVIDAVRASAETMTATANLLGWIDRRGRDG